MPTLELNYIECGQLMNVLANAEGKSITWAVVNPLLMKIGEQLRVQQEMGSALGAERSAANRPDHREGNSGKETNHG